MVRFDDTLVYNKNVYIKPTIKYLASNIDTFKIKNLKFGNVVLKFVDTMQKAYDKELLTIMYNNLSSLKMKKLPFNSIPLAVYFPEENTVGIKNFKFYVLPHELMHMSSTIIENNVIYSGFLIKSYGNDNMVIGNALNEGFTHKYTLDNFYNKKITNNYELYVLIADHLSQIVGENKCKNLFFNANLRGLIEELECYTSFENIALFLQYLDHFLVQNVYGDEKCKMFYGDAIKPKEVYLKTIIDILLDLGTTESVLTIKNNAKSFILDI